MSSSRTPAKGAFERVTWPLTMISRWTSSTRLVSPSRTSTGRLSVPTSAPGPASVITCTTTVPGGTCSRRNDPSLPVTTFEMAAIVEARRVGLKAEMVSPARGVPSRFLTRPSMRPPCDKARRTSDGPFAGSTTTEVSAGAYCGCDAPTVALPGATPAISKAPAASVTVEFKSIHRSRPSPGATALTVAPATPLPPASTTAPRTTPPRPRRIVPASVVRPGTTATPEALPGARSGASTCTT